MLEFREAQGASAITREAKRRVSENYAQSELVFGGSENVTMLRLSGELSVRTLILLCRV